ncbi:MAG: L-lactate permease [Clostridiales bacterium]|nr:L-lactate permease [Clostridiales bacterium]
MTIPVTVFTWMMAVLPILVLLVLMVKMQMGAVKAALIGLLVSSISAILVYRAGIFHIGMELLKGVWSSLAILIVVWPAILLYEVVNEAKAFQVFKQSMGQVTKNELLQIMLLGWIFTSFLQGITGFGVPVAVGAPLLIGIGMQPFWAVVIPLLAHTWGNTYGTLGAAWDALVIQADMADHITLLHSTALWATTFIWIWNFTAGIMLCWFYGRGRALKKGLPAVLVISVIHGGGQLLMSQWNSTLACFVPCCVAIGAIILLGRTPLYRDAWRVEDSPVMNRTKETAGEEAGPADMSVWQAFLPYIALTGLTLIILLVQPIKTFLSQFRLGFAFPGMITGYGFEDAAVDLFSPLTPFTHAGMFLLVSAIFGYVYFSGKHWIGAGSGAAIGKRTVKKTVPSSISVICFIAMSKVMSGTSQTTVMAQGIAGVMGEAYVVLAPVVGLLGSFMTSSNMASNILFGGFQLTTANLLGMDAAPILGAQTAGGAIGAAICPGNIVLGTTTAGIMGKEGMVLRRVLPITLVAAAIVGVIMYGICVL